MKKILTKMATNFSQYNIPIREVTLNWMQASVELAINTYKIKNITVKAARGSGKSTILGGAIRTAVKEMPRSTGVIVGETFVQIKSRTLPSTKEGMEMFGLYEGLDYVVGRCGKELGFEMPFQAPDSWQNVIHFRNGTIAVMVSLDNPNSGRGLNAYWVIGDEAALLTYERLYNNVITTNRAKKAIFKNKPMLHSQIFVTSVPMTKKGDWIHHREKLALEEVRNRVPLHLRKHLFIKANAYINAHNLKDGWIDDMEKEALSKTLFNAEILNIDPIGVQDGFYAQLKPKKHYYKDKDNEYLMDVGIAGEFKPSCKCDQDLVRNVPLQMNLDFGGKINCLTISQYLKTQHRVNFIKEFFRKNPDILDELIDDFIVYYEPHKASCNEVHLYYDRYGSKKEANSKTTLAEDVINRLRRAGWKVIDKTPKTNNPPHAAKYTLLNYILSESDVRLPILRINEDNCPNLIISMENAPLKGNDAFEKDKSSERSTIILQEHATHFSDTLDYNLYWQFWHLADNYYKSSYPISNLLIP
ncbi:hypothetical protein [Chryseobacterium arthrosphaerae]|uniref:hypothetical protein n=1 Tax=Chryseobacterium arthrosphaerae TaxID=651561 RepID=UPI00241C3C93|nr:hypothetical protein [Chryseobacterium arthrosphaerae]